MAKTPPKKASKKKKRSPPKSTQRKKISKAKVAKKSAKKRSASKKHAAKRAKHGLGAALAPSNAFANEARFETRTDHVLALTLAGEIHAFVENFLTKQWLPPRIGDQFKDDDQLPDFLLKRLPLQLMLGELASDMQQRFNPDKSKFDAGKLINQTSGKTIGAFIEAVCYQARLACGVRGH